MNITDFGEKISKCRQNQNMTQEEFAAKLCVTPQAVSRWERNQSLPDITILQDICRILNISADYLLNIESAQISENYDTEVFHQVMAILRSCDEPVSLQFGEGFLELFMQNTWKEYVVEQRNHLAVEGFLLPTVKVMDQLRLNKNEIQIVSYHKVLYKEIIAEITENTGREIIEKLGSVVKENYAHVLNAQIVKILTDNLKISYPAQIEGIVPEKISYSLLLEILKYFVSRGNTMIHLVKLIEFVERELRKQPELTAQELAEGAEKWLIETIYKQ
ncbi:MAG: helix-turn-helix domain-containing protein [Lachnospiraceae bacterium]|nr:helix-turn-helix domain-containing protein [Lachnospiraceae bacterium]